MRERVGVIDIIAAGFTSAAKQWWAMSIPIVLDLYLWLGPRLSPQPFIKQILSKMPLPEGSQVLLGGMNLFSLLSSSLLRVPSTGGAETAAPAFVQPAVLVVDDGLSLLGWVLLLFSSGLFLGSLYLVLLAQPLMPMGGRGRLRQAGALWLRAICLVFFLFAGAIIVGLPATLTITLASLISPLLAQAVSLASLAFLIGIAFYLFFTIEAMVISEVGPLRAAWNSITVVRRNPWSAVGFIILINIIGLGLLRVWRSLGGTAWGEVLAILGNAFVGSGLVASSLLYYRDRYNAGLEEKSGNR